MSIYGPEKKLRIYRPDKTSFPPLKTTSPAQWSEREDTAQMCVTKLFKP